jgi:nucleoside-diphosphate-sugar epimerase
MCKNKLSININDNIIEREEHILVTGASGFIGIRLIERLLKSGFNNLRCFVRSNNDLINLKKIVEKYKDSDVQIIQGNLTSREDCYKAINNVSLIFHLAVARGEKSYANAYLNSVITTRNIIEAALKQKYFKRFVSISSISVYDCGLNWHPKSLDENKPLLERPEIRGEPYCFAKVHQDRLVIRYGKEYGLPYVIVRPGYVYGPGNPGIPSRVGISSFGIFLHLAGYNRIPLVYVDNCADAILLCGLKKGVEGETFNVVDDELPTGWKFLRLYKKNVRNFRSVYLPHFISYLFCCLWEKYCDWSLEQLPRIFNRSRWASDWRGNKYPTTKIKEMVGWMPKVNLAEGLTNYFKFEKEGK